MSQVGRNTTIQGEFWTETEPLVDQIPGPLQEVSQLSNTILTEAQYYFSGIIHGYRFSYIPLDRTRNIQESFTLEPIALVPRGSPGLRFIEAKKVENQFFLRLLYEPTPPEQVLWNRWKSASLPSSQGQGSFSLFGEGNPRLEAFRDACKEAVRAHGRIISRNKPDEIKGTLVLTQIPSVRISQGNFVVQVRIRLKVDTIDAYRTW